MQLLKFLPFAALVSMVSACLNMSTPPTSPSSSSDDGVTIDTILLEGELGEGYDISMMLIVSNDSSVIGAYKYDEDTSFEMFCLKGTKVGGKFSLAEFSRGGEQTGTFNGSYADGVLCGRYDTSIDSIDFALNKARYFFAFDNSFNMIDFDKFEIESTDYAITRLEINRGRNDPESMYYDPGCYSWYDYEEAFERATDSFVEYVNNFDKNDSTKMKELGINMMEYLDDFGEYLYKGNNLPPRLSVDNLKTYHRFCAALDSLKQRLQ